MKYKDNRIYIPIFVVGISLIFIFIRFLWLDKIASGISDDELFYVLTAKSFFLTGKDLSQTVHLQSLNIPPGIYAPFARVPSMLFSIIIGPSPLSLFTSRLPYAITGVLFAFVLYGIMAKLMDKRTAIITALITLISPWNIVFFRTSFDTPIAVFFTFLTIYIVLAAKNWFILFAYPVFIAALYSYIGTSTIVGIFILPAIYYAWRVLHKSRYFLQYLLLTLAISVTWLLFYQSVQTQNFGSRLNEILSPTSSYIATRVDTERRSTINTPVTTLFLNKATVFGRMFLDKYFGAFSPTLLFTNGEGRTTFSLYSHGLFYYIDIVFVLTGLYVLFRNKRTLFYFFVSMMLLAPVPAVFSILETSYTLRSSLLYPFILMTIAVGISTLLSKRKFHTNIVFSGIICIVYALLLINFLNIYFFKNPITNSEGFGFSGRILARYLAIAKKNNIDTYIIERGSSRELFNQYIFYSNQYTQHTASKIADIYLKNVYDWDTIHFTKCQTDPYPINSTVVLKADLGCPIYDGIKEKIVIPQLADNGSIYFIYNDAVCNTYELGTYVHDITFEDLDVENLSTEQFCKKYLVKPLQAPTP